MLRRHARDDGRVPERLFDFNDNIVTYDFDASHDTPNQPVQGQASSLVFVDAH